MASRSSGGVLFVLSAPSGTGKTTVAAMLHPLIGDLHKTVSHTTRKKRDGEENGVDYHFISEAEFQGMVGRGEFVEWAQVFKSYYGTSYREIESALARGEDLLLVIDVQGAASVRAMKNLPSCSIFLLPPSIEELERRLTLRGLDTEESIRLRLQSAQGELAHKDEFDYRVVNDNLNEAVDQVYKVIMTEREKRRGKPGGGEEKKS